MSSLSARPLPTLAEIRAERSRRAARKHRRKALRSFAYFLRHFVYIGDGGGSKFKPWPWQVDLARRLPSQRRLVCLKARQLGISWLAAAYALWVAIRQPGSLVLLVSQTEDDAIELLEKVQLVFDHLPDWLKPDRWKSNTRSLRFRSLRSGIVALPSTKRAGRGRTAKLVVADEHALHTWATENYNALAPTIDAGGQFWSISTADGIGNFFADVCSLATANMPWVQPRRDQSGIWRLTAALKAGEKSVPQDGWLPVFLPYDAREGRDPGWWERKRAAHPKQRLFFQEYPRDPEEAFVQTGRPVFAKPDVERQKALCCEPVPEAAWPFNVDGNGRRTSRFPGMRPEELRIWAHPEPKHRYVAGADVAEGLEHGDFSDLVVFDLDAGERPVEVLSLHGHWPPDQFAKLIDQVARVYPGVYGVERNNHGHTVLVILRGLGTPGLFRERPVLNNLGQEIEPGKLGWLTTTVTKPLMIDELEQALRTLSVELRDRLAIPELTFYQTLKDGSTGAPTGKWDDRVMSRAIAVQMIKRARAAGEIRPVSTPSRAAKLRW